MATSFLHGDDQYRYFRTRYVLLENHIERSLLLKHSTLKKKSIHPFALLYWFSHIGKLPNSWPCLKLPYNALQTLDHCLRLVCLCIVLLALSQKNWPPKQVFRGYFGPQVKFSGWNTEGLLYGIIIHQTHYEKSDWSRAFNQFTIACELDMINAISAAYIAFIMSSWTSAWLLSPLECSPQKQNGWMLCFCFWRWMMWKMYNKTIIEFGFRMISWIIKTSCLWYLPQPLASADHTDLGFDNSWYRAQSHAIIVNCIVHACKCLQAVSWSFFTFAYKKKQGLCPLTFELN